MSVEGGARADDLGNPNSVVGEEIGEGGGGFEGREGEEGGVGGGFGDGAEEGAGVVVVAGEEIVV